MFLHLVFGDPIMKICKNYLHWWVLHNLISKIVVSSSFIYSLQLSKHSTSEFLTDLHIANSQEVSSAMTMAWVSDKKKQISAGFGL